MGLSEAARSSAINAGMSAGCVQLTPMATVCGKAATAAGALAEEFAVGDVLLVAAGEGEPGGEFRMSREGLADGLGFGERGKRFEGEEVRRFSGRRRGKDIDALAMKLDKSSKVQV